MCIAYLLHEAVLLEKLTSSKLVKKFTAFYGTRNFVTAFTSARHLSLPWASSKQTMPSQPTSWRFTLLLSSHLHLELPSGLFPSDFPTKILYRPLLSQVRATCHAHLIRDFITRQIMGEEYRSKNVYTGTKMITRYKVKSVQSVHTFRGTPCIPDILLCSFKFPGTTFRS
jgi:hypothetical protein